MGVIGVLQAPQKRPDAQQPPARGSRLIFRLPPPLPQPASLVHTRAIGDPGVVGAPGNLVHARALGAPQVAVLFPTALKLVITGKRLVYERGELQPSRFVFFLEAQLPAPGNLVHERALGDPFVRVSPAPAGLARARSLGSPTVRIPAAPAPESLVHARVIGSVLLIAAPVVPPAPPAPAGERTLRSVYRYAARRRGLRR